MLRGGYHPLKNLSSHHLKILGFIVLAILSSILFVLYSIGVLFFGIFKDITLYIKKTKSSNEEMYFNRSSVWPITSDTTTFTPIDVRPTVNGVLTTNGNDDGDRNNDNFLRNILTDINSELELELEFNRRLFSILTIMLSDVNIIRRYGGPGFLSDTTIYGYMYHVLLSLGRNLFELSPQYWRRFSIFWIYIIFFMLETLI